MPAPSVRASSITAGGATAVTSLTLTLPTFVAGDILSARVGAKGDVDVTGPAGWTKIASGRTAQGSDISGAVFTKTAVSGEANPTFSIGATGKPMTGGVVSIMDCDGVDTDANGAFIASVQIETSNTAPNWICPSLTTQGPDRLLLAGGFGSDDRTSTPPTGWVEIGEDPNGTTGPTVTIASLAQAAAGATGLVSGTWSTGTETIGILVAYKPKAADTTAPTVTVDKASNQNDPTGSSPVNFTAVFSESVTGLIDADVTIGGTAGATTAAVTGSGTTYNIAVSGMTASGSVIVSLPAGAAQDAAGNQSTASTSTDNSVDYNAPASAFALVQKSPLVSTGATDTSVTASFPATPTAGNLLAAKYFTFDPSTLTIPAGWSLAGNAQDAAGGPEIYLLYRVAQSGDPAGLTLTPGAAGIQRLLLEEWSGNLADQAAVLDQGLPSYNANLTNGHTTATASPVASDDLALIAFGTSGAVTAFDPWSNSFATQAADTRVSLASKPLAASGDTFSSIIWSGTARRGASVLATFKSSAAPTTVGFTGWGIPM